MGYSRQREHRVLIIVITLAVLGAGSAVIAAFKISSPWVIGGGVVMVAAVAAVSELWRERYRRIAARRDESMLKLEDGCLVLPDGRLPKVGQIDDPVRLGVHPAIFLSMAPDGDPPLYVPRDVDEQVRGQLANTGFVLLVGDSTAGKSRTAYEAVRATLPEHVLIAPHDRTALPAAIEYTVRESRAVLWLSDLEHYLGTGGLTRERIARITAGKGHRVIVATLRSAEQARLTNPSEDADDTTRSVGRQVRETLEQARTFRLERLFTAGELEGAVACLQDPRISSAVRQAADFGIAEYLASGPELVRDVEDGWDVGVNPRGAALVSAAIDCRRAGYTGPAPRALIEEAHFAYLEAKGGERLRPESLQEAWAWAIRPRRATTALLSPVANAPGAGVTVFDYLVDRRQKTEGPLAQVDEPVILAALAHIHRSEDAEQIAATAERQGRFRHAETAYRIAWNLRQRELSEEHPDTLISWNNLAVVLRRLGRLEEAEAGFWDILAIRRRILGEEHPHTLTSRNDLAGVLKEVGRSIESEAEHRAVLEVRRRVLGREHPDTLISWNDWASVLKDLGRLEQAEVEHRAELEVCRRVLGEEHLWTLFGRNNWANVLRHLGRLEEAEAEFRDLLEVDHRVLGEEHPFTLISRNNLALVLGGMGRLEEAEVEHRAVLELRRRILGEEHPHTLTSISNLALVLRAQGGS